MTKRKVTFNDNIDVKKYKNEDTDVVNEPPQAQRVLYAFKSKHSLDSDEEDNIEEIKNMGYNEIEGQENDTITDYDTIEITPFNMREEMDEGKFDETGNFIFNKKKTEIRDNWIDNINWVEIKEQSSTKSSVYKDEDHDSQEQFKPTTEIKTIYNSILNLLLPGENILKALRRLGKNANKDPLADKFSSSASARLKFKKEQKKIQEALAEKGGENADLNPQQEPVQTDLLKLTGLADELLQNGIFDIYEHTYEKLAHLIKGETLRDHEPDTFGHGPAATSEEPNPEPADANLDIFEGID